MNNAIILCSGGIDSVTTAFYVKKRLSYDKIIVLFFNYGQHSINPERKASKNCAEKLNAKFIEIKLEELGKISNSLINKDGKIKELKREELKNTKEESEKYYVPCRNTIFLSNALAYAEGLFIKNQEEIDIFVGFKCEGKESYPDTTKEYVDIINKLSEISCNGKFKIIAPLIEKDKEDIIILGKELGIDFKNTFSCYVGKEKHCGKCLACMLRKEGFYWSNVQDETEYR